MCSCTCCPSTLNPGFASPRITPTSSLGRVVICFAINFTLLSSSVAVPGVDQLQNEIKQKAYHVSAYQRITYQSVSGWSRGSHTHSRGAQARCPTKVKKPSKKPPQSIILLSVCLSLSLSPPVARSRSAFTSFSAFSFSSSSSSYLRLLHTNCVS